MNCNTWKVMLVFSALLMFAFTGELAAQSLTLEPDGQTIGIGENFDLTATLLDGSSSPLADSAVYFWMISANGNVAPNTDNTDASGEANSRYYSQSTLLERTDTLYAIGIYNSGADTLSDTISVEVVAKPASLTLAPTGQMIGIGESLDLTATLLDQLDDPVVDSTVSFSVVSGGGSVLPTSDVTDGNGEAVTTYTAGGSEGTARVAARGIYSNSAGTDTLVDTIDIVVSAKPALLNLSPTGRSIVFNEQLQLTATLLDQLDDPVVDSTVSFSVVSGGGSVSPSSDVTDESGEAVTIYTAGSSAGTARVAAMGIYSNSAGTDTIVDTIDIVVVNAPSQVTLLPETASLALNGSRIFQARV
ncbi:Ig-like domain-containing protein, partial [candidate division WOR-3 bacterium]|nr:Ig-like domain-containing protein [candidate division WOR-3 bacterium]